MPPAALGAYSVKPGRSFSLVAEARRAYRKTAAYRAYLEKRKSSLDYAWSQFQSHARRRDLQGRLLYSCEDALLLLQRAPPCGDWSPRHRQRGQRSRLRAGKVRSLLHHVQHDEVGALSLRLSRPRSALVVLCLFLAASPRLLLPMREAAFRHHEKHPHLHWLQAPRCSQRCPF